MSNPYILGDLSYKINGLCFRVHNNLGRFCREKQYSDEFEKILIQNKIGYKREFKISQLTESPEGNIADFIIEDKLILEFKAKRFITREDYYQILRYLKAANIKLGLIVNFRNTYLKPKRVINNEYS